MAPHALPLPELPAPAMLRQRWRTLAILEVILTSDWESRYFSFDPNWGEDEMASMRDGEGSACFFLFTKAGCAGKILSAGELSQSCLNDIPREMNSFLTEPAFSLDSATCCLWRLENQEAWQCTPDRKALPIMEFFKDDGDYYANWAEDYYEVNICRETVERIAADLAATNGVREALIRKLNPDANPDLLTAEFKEMGIILNG